MDLHSHFTSRVAAYRAVASHAGVSFRCLDADAGDAPPAAVVEADDKGAATVRVQGPLDWFFGFDYRALIEEMDKIDPKSIHLLIESPGGFLSDGLALYSDLRARARDGVSVTAEARGVVASAATLPFLAADARTMSTGTALMVHEPYSFLILSGTADNIEASAKKAAKGLRSGEKTLRGVIAERTGADRDTVSAWLKEETWFGPEEAVEGGLATVVIEDAWQSATEDEQARATARRIMAAWRLKLTKEKTP